MVTLIWEEALLILMSQTCKWFKPNTSSLNWTEKRAMFSFEGTLYLNETETKIGIQNLPSPWWAAEWTCYFVNLNSRSGFCTMRNAQAETIFFKVRLMIKENAFRNRLCLLRYLKDHNMHIPSSGRNVI